VMCTCSNQRIACLEHFYHLCACNPTTKYLSMRFTLSALKTILINLENRLELLTKSKTIKKEQLFKTSSLNRKKKRPLQFSDDLGPKKLTKLARTGGLKPTEKLMEQETSDSPSREAIISSLYYKDEGRPIQLNTCVSCDKWDFVRSMDVHGNLYCFNCVSESK